MADSIMCVGCNEPIEDGEEAKRVTDVMVRKGICKEKKEWGVLHVSCFNRAIDSPDATMDEIRREVEGVSG